MIPVHSDLDIPLYRQRLLFLVDDDMLRGQAWIQTLFQEKVARPSITNEPTVNGMCYALEHSTGAQTFVVWLRDWDGTPRNYARLAHECLHAVIHVFRYIGHQPRFVPRDSEPVTYLLYHLIFSCLNAIKDTHEKARPEKPAGRQKNSRRHRGRQ